MLRKNEQINFHFFVLRKAEMVKKNCPPETVRRKKSEKCFEDFVMKVSLLWYCTLRPGLCAGGKLEFPSARTVSRM
jgi:hypothetical protein